MNIYIYVYKVYALISYMQKHVYLLLIIHLKLYLFCQS